MKIQKGMTFCQENKLRRINMYIAIRKRLTSTLAQVPLSGTIFFSTHKKTDMYGISQQKGIQIQHFRQQTNPPPSPVGSVVLALFAFFRIPGMPLLLSFPPCGFLSTNILNQQLNNVVND